MEGGGVGTGYQELERRRERKKGKRHQPCPPLVQLIQMD